MRERSRRRRCEPRRRPGWRRRRRALVALALLAFAPAEAAGSWTPPVPVAPAGDSYPHPRVGVDARGNAIAVWRSGPLGGTEQVVRAATRPADGAWQPPSVLSAASRDALSSDTVDLAVSANGDAVAAWLLTRGPDSVVQAAVRPAGGAWQPPVELAANGLQPQVAIDARGNALAMWTRGQEGIMNAVRPAGGAWSAASRLGRPDGGPDTSPPRFAFDARGTAHAVWLDAGGLQSALRPAGGDWQPPITFARPASQIIAGYVAFDTPPELAVAPSGDEVAVWMHTAGNERVMQAAGRARGGAWEPPVDISAREPIMPKSAPELSVVVFDANRTAIASWGWVGGTGAQAAVRPLGGAWGPPTAIFDQPGFLRLAADPLGNTFGVSSADAVTAVLRSGDAWLPPVTVSPPSSKARLLDVAGDPRGGAVAVWGDDFGGVSSADYEDRAAVISGLRLSPRRFRTRTRVSYALDLAARVRIAVERLRPGRRAGGRCVAPTRGNRGRPACSRYARVRRLERVRPAGDDAFMLSGRSLRRGGYRLTATPADRATAGVPARVRFRVTR